MLDACVLIPMPLADTLLRMAEEPRLFLAEVVAKDRRHFPEAWVEGRELLIPVTDNDPRDRHVPAAAVHSRSDLIVTCNRRDFPAESLGPWGIEVQGPSAFLPGLYDLDAGLFVNKLHEQAACVQVNLPQLLRSLKKNVPAFYASFCQQEGIASGGGAECAMIVASIPDLPCPPGRALR